MVVDSDTGWAMLAPVEQSAYTGGQAQFVNFWDQWDPELSERPVLDRLLPDGTAVVAARITYRSRADDEATCETDAFTVGSVDGDLRLVAYDVRRVRDCGSVEAESMESGRRQNVALVHDAVMQGGELQLFLNRVTRGTLDDDVIAAGGLTPSEYTHLSYIDQDIILRTVSVDTEATVELYGCAGKVLEEWASEDLQWRLTTNDLVWVDLDAGRVNDVTVVRC